MQGIFKEKLSTARSGNSYEGQSQGQCSPGQGVKRAAPPEAETFCVKR